MTSRIPSATAPGTFPHPSPGEPNVDPVELNGGVFAGLFNPPALSATLPDSPSLAFEAECRKFESFRVYFASLRIPESFSLSLARHDVTCSHWRRISPRPRAVTMRYGEAAMDIYVYSRSAIEVVKPHEVPHVVISITSASSDVARLRTNDLCRGVCRLAFVDAEVPSEKYPEEMLFSPQQAAQVWEFVHQHHLAVQRIIVHCDAGYSRSPAMAAALAKELNGDDAQYFAGRYKPNARVHRLVGAAIAEWRSTRPVKSS